MPNLQEALVELNPWWKGEFDVSARPREIETELAKYLPKRQILALTGLRRVGKTTLLMRLASQAIHGGLDPRRVMYFTFDEFRGASFRDVISAWEHVTHGQSSAGRGLLLLDEVQKAEGWADQAKALYDRHRNLKMILSGSESLFLRHGTRESLAGRLFSFQVRPLNFREFLDFTGVRRDPLELHRAEVARNLPAFVRSQGFPELVVEQDLGVVRKYIRESIVEKVVYRDLPQMLNLAEPSALEALLNMLMEEPGQILEVTRIGKDLGMSRQTASAYVGYLEQAFLIHKLYNWSPGRRKAERKLKKYYPAVVAPALTGRADDAARSRVLEWLVVTQSQAEFFWRDPYQHEVDMVLPGPVPVEVKYGRVETAGIEAFLRRHKSTRAAVVTRERRGELQVGRARVEMIPAYEFLLREREDHGSS